MVLTEMLVVFLTCPVDTYVVESREDIERQIYILEDSFCDISFADNIEELLVPSPTEMLGHSLPIYDKELVQSAMTGRIARYDFKS